MRDSAIEPGDALPVGRLVSGYALRHSPSRRSALSLERRQLLTTLVNLGVLAKELAGACLKTDSLLPLRVTPSTGGV